MLRRYRPAISSSLCCSGEVNDAHCVIAWVGAGYGWPEADAARVRAARVNAYRLSLVSPPPPFNRSQIIVFRLDRNICPNDSICKKSTLSNDRRGCKGACM